MSTIERVTPYIERLMDDDDVQDRVRKALRSGSSAAGRARKKGNAKKAARDPKVRQQALAALIAAREAAATLSEPPRKPKSRWLKRLLVVGLLGAAAFLAVDEDAREKLMDAIGMGSEGPAA